MQADKVVGQSTDARHGNDSRGRSRYSPFLSSQFHGIYSEGEIEELSASSEWLGTLAPSSCTRKDVGGMEEWAKRELQAQGPLSCDWYHGTWQVLRLLNMVAVPRWYPFYHHALTSVLHVKPSANVLISAAADYGMLATLHDAVRSTGATPRITLYDICDTPLKSSQWFAERHNIKLNTVRANILETEMPEAPFDLIVTDEFLSVLKSDYKWRATERWKELLVPGGAVVTTAMVGTATTQALRDSFFERSKSRFLESRHVLFPYCSDSDVPAMIERLQRFAAYHTRHMLFGHLDVQELFRGFRSVSYEVTTTPGECVNPTNSHQIVAIR